MIKAIETTYAGCHFRSRLEARWAVFFDAMEIEWQYEPEAFEFQTNEELDGTYEVLRYLPDFYLPRSQTWVEVKGSLDEVDWEKLAWATDYARLPHSEDGLYADPPRVPGLLLLGNVPRPLTTLTPTFPVLQHRKGVHVLPAFFTAEGLMTQRQRLDAESTGMPFLERWEYMSGLLYEDRFEASWGHQVEQSWVEMVKDVWPERKGWLEQPSPRHVNKALTLARSHRFGT